jgi:hypothetical protein
MTRRIEVLLADIKRLRAQMQASGTLSDESKPETQLVKVVDELAFIMQGQFGEIEKLKREVRKSTRRTVKR